MIIIITRPDFFSGEAHIINRMFEAGLQIMHLRKPKATQEELEKLITQINPKYHCRIVLHDHQQLAPKYHLYGIHLNSRNPNRPTSWQGSVSRSCHSLAELQSTPEKFNYQFLSPIFDSISKQGYLSAFTPDKLTQAATQRIINNHVYALGGITLERIPQIRTIGFGGAAILGEAWQTPNIEKYVSNLIQADNRQE